MKMKIAIALIIAIVIGFFTGLLTFRHFHFSKMIGKNGWNVDGVTQESQFCGLNYCPSSGHVVAQFRNSSNQKSFYVKHKSESSYHKIQKQSDDLSYENPVVADSSKTLFFNVMKSVSSDAMNWNMVTKLDLVTNQVSPVFTEADHKGDNLWISSLYGMSSDGSKLLCSAFLDGKFWLCYLDPNSKQLERISVLNNTFF